MSMTIPQCIILEIQDRLSNDSIYAFDSVFLEIPVNNCIVLMLLLCFFEEVVKMEQ